MEKREYSEETHNLILEMEKVNLRQEFIFDKEKIIELIKEVHAITKIDIKPIVWCDSIFDENLARASRAAGASRAARASRAAGASRAVGIDYDFDNYIFEKEWFMNNEGNENDKKALAIYQHFWELRKVGLGYMTEDKNNLYLVPAPIVQFSNGRFHSLTNPAIAWKDKKIYFIQGVHFDEELWKKVIDKKLPVRDILQLKNIEQRYVSLMLYGAENMLKELDAQLISESAKKNQLYSLKNIIKNKEIKMLKYACPSTGRVYVSFVPENFTDADSAMSWKFQIEKHEYELLKMEA